MSYNKAESGDGGKALGMWHACSFWLCGMTEGDIGFDWEIAFYATVRKKTGNEYGL